MISRSAAAARYIPNHTRVLFIAEAPPNSPDRYFYFEDVKRDDWLWIALMKALYRPELKDTKEERKRKRQWLARFQRDGFRLIDAVKRPLDGSNRARVTAIRAAAPALISEIKDITPDSIILIKSTVHEVLFHRLRSLGFTVINETALPFPATGQQRRFQDEFHRLVLSGKFPLKEKASPRNLAVSMN
jgi:hypothetical protein